MQYLCLIYESEAQMTSRTEAEQGEIMKGYFALNAAMKEAGIPFSGNALQGTPTATTVRLRDGQALTTDGPFAETKEQLGGYYLIEVDNLDEAMKWAARIPTAKHGSIEVRPIMDIPGDG